MAAVGLDLGTANTVLAYLDTNGEPKIADLGDGGREPSVVYFPPGRDYPIIGSEAQELYEQMEGDPSRCFRRWKLKIGTPEGEDPLTADLALSIGDEGKVPVTPSTLTTLLVQHLIQSLEPGTVDGIVADTVLVTVPNGWRSRDPRRCRDTRLAAEKARVEGKKVPIRSATVSEPVAATAYYVYQYRRTGKTDLNGRNLLVVDVGAGTFDLSLVRVGAPGEPIVVEDALNNDLAGDFADALLCGHFAQQINERQSDTVYPTDAMEILQRVEAGGPDAAYLRQWMREARKIKERITNWEGRTDANRETASTRLELPTGQAEKVSLNLEGFWSQLGPFYKAGQELLGNFLKVTSAKDNPPFAVVLCGGGGRIAGLRRHVLQPVLSREFGASAAQDMMTRIPVSDQYVDKAIALGAALIAGDVIPIRECLLHDIGIVFHLDPEMAEYASAENIPAGQPLLVTPVLKRGTDLPARVSSDDLQMMFTLPNGGPVELFLVIQDDPERPLHQAWKIEVNQKGREAPVSFHIDVDTEGMLTATVRVEGHETMKFEGRVTRYREKETPSFLYLTHRDSSRLNSEQELDYAKVTPDQIRAISDRLLKTWHSPRGGRSR
jgi:molecular chaperone DnaK (HSP70)